MTISCCHLDADVLLCEAEARALFTARHLAVTWQSMRIPDGAKVYS